MTAAHSRTVLRCDEQGAVARVVGGRLLADGRPPAPTLFDLVEPDEHACVEAMLETLRDVGAVFDRRLTLRSGEGPARRHVAAVRLADDSFVALASAEREALQALRIVLAGAEGREAALLRYVLDDRLRLLQRATNGAVPDARPDQTLTVPASREGAPPPDAFVSMAAHELRNPLATIRFYSGCLLDLDLAREKQRHFLSIIQETSTFMGQLIEELLTVSTIEAGHLRLQLAEVDVCAVAARCYEVHRMLAEEKGIRLAFVRCAETIPALVDAGKLTQVFNNLLSNAVKFSRAGTSVTMRLTARPDSVCIAVEDEGPGIPADEVPLLFQPFQRTSVRSTAGERSTGLGLAICRNIVDGHDGRLWVESEVGRGSTFYVRLPRRAEPPAPAAAAPAGGEATT